MGRWVSAPARAVALPRDAIVQSKRGEEAIGRGVDSVCFEFAFLLHAARWVIITHDAMGQVKRGGEEGGKACHGATG